jgi:hypothetical protein
MSRSSLTQAAWTFALLVVAALSLELAVRIDDWAQFSVPLAARETSLGDLVVRDSLGIHARPSAQFRKFRINSLGVRGDEVPAPVLVRSPIVITAGASETFGLYESARHEWPQQLEDSLHLRCLPPPVVLNSAFAGMSLPTVRQDYSRRLKPLQAKVLVYYPTPMQYLELDLPVAASPATSRPAELPAWRSRAIPRFRDAVKHAVPDGVLNLLRVFDTERSRASLAGGVRQEAGTERLNAFDRDLRAFVGDLRNGGTSPVLVVHRNRFRDTVSVEERRLLRAWERFYPLYSASAILTFDDSAAGRMARVARDSSLILIDPLPRLIPLHASAFADFTHFTDRGSAAVAGSVAAGVAQMLCAGRDGLPSGTH